MKDLYQPSIRTVNSGSFAKGSTPWNKGRKGMSTRGNPREFAVKGKQGFRCRPVLCINPDGTVHARFPSVAAATKAVGASDRHSIIQACQGKFRCRGYRWFYEEDYIPWADYHYKLRTGRDVYGRLKKGNCLCVGQKLTPEGLLRKKVAASRRAKEMNSNPDSNFGRFHCQTKPCRDITTGTDYPSVKAAAEATGFKAHQISAAITRNGTVHGHKFVRLTSKPSTPDCLVAEH